MTAEPPPRSEGPDPDLDVEAAFADIVARWGPVASVDEGAGNQATGPSAPDPFTDPFTGSVTGPVAEPRVEPSPEPAAGSPEEVPLNDRAGLDDEGHFVPPPPPPLPIVEPRRLLAWLGLFGTPVLGLLLLLAHVSLPALLTFALVSAFVGGFAYLVATMNSSTPDEWSGDDGAVL